MCLVLIAIQSHPYYKLIIAFNRDEFRNRPTARAGFWEDAPQLLAGRDLSAGGTWFGVTKQGRIAGITNNQDPAFLRTRGPSRGKLTRDFLLSRETPADYIHGLVQSKRQYSGYNLIVGDKNSIYWYSNITNSPVRLSPKIYGLSNHLLDTPWPKVTGGKQLLQRLITGKGALREEDLFSLMSGRSSAHDRAMADSTHASIFLSGAYYGTRSSTILLIDHSDQVTFIERTYDPDEHNSTTVRYEFPITAQS